MWSMHMLPSPSSATSTTWPTIPSRQLQPHRVPPRITRSRTWGCWRMARPVWAWMHPCHGSCMCRRAPCPTIANPLPMAMPAASGSPRIISITMEPSMPNPAMQWLPMPATYTTIRITRCPWITTCPPVPHPLLRRRLCPCAMAYRGWPWCMAIRRAGDPSATATTIMWLHCPTTITTTATSAATIITGVCVVITDTRWSRAAHWVAPRRRRRSRLTLSCISSITRADRDRAVYILCYLNYINLLYN